jgi:hypothetical protein
MQQTINKLSLLKEINNEEFLENTKIVKNLSSFKETKEFRKRNLKIDVLLSIVVKLISKKCNCNCTNRRLFVYNW